MPINGTPVISEAMTIVYDLRYASDHFPGIGTHAFWLLRSLLDLPGQERYVVLWNDKLQNSRFPFGAIRSHDRVRWVECGAPVLGLSAAWELGSLLRTLRPGLYFSPFSLQPMRAGCPTVLTLHDVIPLKVSRAAGVIERLMFRIVVARAGRARFVVTSSEFSRDEIASVGIPPGRIRVVRPGVPESDGSPMRRPAGVPDEPFALVVGINKPHKNLEMLAECWAEFGGQPPLHLVGAGPTDDRYPGLRLLADRHGAKRVTALGRVAEDELRWLYRNATLMLVPSRYEGFGFPMAEAFAAGVPVVASDIPALRELGRDGACFVPADDPRGWAAAVRALCKSPEERQRLVLGGRERADELTYGRAAGDTIGLLREGARVPA